MQRERALASGRLLEAHLTAGQQAVVDCTFAAIAVVDDWLLNEKSGPIEVSSSG